MRTSRHPVPRRAGSLSGIVVAPPATLAGLPNAAPAAQADTMLGEPFGTTTVQGRYVAQNNRWGGSTTQSSVGQAACTTA